MEKFKQFWINLGRAFKNFILSFKVIDKKQYAELVEKLLENKDKAFEYFDTNKNNEIQCSEIIEGIKKLIKKGE